MPQFATCAHVLHCREITALVMYRRESVARVLLGDMCEPFTLTALALGCIELRTISGSAQHTHGVVGHASTQFAIRILVKGAARRIGRTLCDFRQFKRFAVVETRMSTAMSNDDGMFAAYQIEIVKCELRACQ